MLIYFELGFMSQAHQAQSATSLFRFCCKVEFIV